MIIHIQMEVQALNHLAVIISALATILPLILRGR